MISAVLVLGVNDGHRFGRSVFHELRGARAGTFAMWVTCNQRLTFRFEDGRTGDVLDVDFEDYH